MQRTNTFEVWPLSEQDRALLLELLDASAACYNEVNYQRRQAYFQAQSEHEGGLPVSELEAVVRDATTQERPLVDVRPGRSRYRSSAVV